MCRAGDTGIESAHDPPHGPLQLHVHTIGGDVAFCGNAECLLNGQHIVNRGDDELGLGDEVVLDLIMVDEWATRGLN